jgi:hypothetical protein
MSPLIINDLSFCHDEVSGIEGAGFTPINLEQLNVSLSVGLASLVLTQFPDFAGAAFGAAAAISASQGATSYADQNIFIS